MDTVLYSPDYNRIIWKFLSPRDFTNLCCVCRKYMDSVKLNEEIIYELLCKQYHEDIYEKFVGLTTWKESRKAYKITLELFRDLIQYLQVGEEQAHFTTLLELPMFVAYIHGHTKFSRQEMFSILLRFNTMHTPMRYDSTIKQLSIIERHFDEEDWKWIFQLVLGFCRTQYINLVDMLGWICGDHNADQLNLTYFKTKSDTFVVTASGKKGNDNVNPWIVLRSNCRIPITDKESVANAVRIILDQSKYPLTFSQLRILFAQETGIPFGHCNCGTMVHFFRQHSHMFHVDYSKHKRHEHSRVSIHPNYTNGSSTNQKQHKNKQKNKQQINTNKHR